MSTPARHGEFALPLWLRVRIFRDRAWLREPYDEETPRVDMESIKRGFLMMARTAELMDEPMRLDVADLPTDSGYRALAELMVAGHLEHGADGIFRLTPRGRFQLRWELARPLILHTCTKRQTATRG